MNSKFTLSVAACLLVFGLHAQQRYIDEVFPNIIKLENQIYAVNVTVVTGTGTADTLTFDLYAPAGDVCSKRPLAVVLHTGTFLPRGLIAPVGNKDDYANQQVCTRLAKSGYVAASVRYRVGWNPISPDANVRRNTIINAAYRSIQDLYTFIRFMNMTVVEQNNPFRIDTSRVAIFGIGTGGFVALNAAVLTQEEIFINKFRDPITGTPFIDTLLSGDLHGEKPGLINIPFWVGYNDDFDFVFGLDGGIGDSSWIEDGNSVPISVVGTVTHPTTPFGIDPITGEINPDLPVYANNNYVVNIMGSLPTIKRANELGINDPLTRCEKYEDAVSEKIRQNPNTRGQEHIWAINLPGPQTGPWEYWDSTFWDLVPSPIPGLSIHDLAIATNPDMGFEKANHYIDTALWVFRPRSYAALNLGALVCNCDGVVEDPLVIDDFECNRPDPTYGSGNDKLCVIDNEYPAPENNSEKIGEYHDPAHDPWAALCVPITDVLDTFYIDVWGKAAGTPFLFKLEGGSSPAFETWVNTTVSDAWETLKVDFSAHASEDHARVCIFPNAGVDTDEGEFYFDNLRWNFGTGIFNPVIPELVFTPNPASDFLYVQNPGAAVQYKVFNAVGQQTLVHTAFGGNHVAMPVQSLTPGVYSIGAFDTDGNLVASGRFTKQ